MFVQQSGIMKRSIYKLDLPRYYLPLGIVLAVLTTI